MGLVGNVCYFRQAYHHRHGRSVEISKAVRGAVDDSKHCEACVLCQCAAVERWGEEVDENWVGNGVESCFEGTGTLAIV